MKRLTIEASTALCQLQDAGRFGVRHLGVTQGGALDWVAMYWANWLLGNALDAPVVEVTLGASRWSPRTIAPWPWPVETWMRVSTISLSSPGAACVWARASA